MILRPATHADAPAIANLWNNYIRDTTITFTTEEKTIEDLKAYIDARQSGGMSVIVAEDEGLLHGFAAASLFRQGPGYLKTLETSVMLTPETLGRGVGRALMRQIEDSARSAGIHVLVAGMSGTNDQAIAFHESIGFVRVGLMPEVGRKFGRWLDLVFMQKTLES